jgi:hypothetical protein
MDLRRRKLIAVVSILLVSIIAGTVALAATNPETITPAWQARVAVRRERLEAKAAGWLERLAGAVADHPDLAAKLAEIRQLRQANTTLATQNAELRAELTAELKAIRNSGNTLPEATKTQLREYAAEAKLLHASLRESAGDIRAAIAAAAKRQVFRTLNYPRINDLLDEVIGILQARNDDLTGLNEIYTAALALVA